MSTNDFSLSGQVALVTGAKRGLGRELALTFARAGADVALCTRDFEGSALQGVADEVKKMGRRSLAVQADTSRATDVDNLVAKVVQEFGRIDVLVNNAAVLIKGMVLDMPLADWERHFDVNVKGYYLVSRAVAAKMIERKKGSIINISSDLAFKAIPAHAAYCTSKAAIIMLTRALALELGPYGIRVNTVAPGMFRTELSKPNWTNPEFMKHMESITPLGRIGEPEEMTGAVLYLASSASSYVSGTTILVNGGGLV
jgi:NAD(P)-dependent dehydrogenase (short-subunit alcohol dehydrogenase family)